MSNETVIYEQGNFRILCVADQYISFEDLCGEVFTAKMNPDKTAEELAKEEQEFAALVDREGVYGFVLERWNPAKGIGWEHVDSCFGFVGVTDPETGENHYIVDELKNQIKE